MQTDRFKFFLVLAVCIAALTAGSACQKDSGSTSSASGTQDATKSGSESSTSTASVWTPTEPNPKLPTLKVWIGPEELETEIARTPKQRQTGMMFRESMEEMDAMLFVFSFPQQLGFYMKNTSIPLSCAYINPEGKIEEIHDLHPFVEDPVFSESDRVQYVLEVRQGWFEDHNIKPGMSVATEKGSLLEAFSGVR